jgi:hypothetical protein
MRIVPRPRLDFGNRPSHADATRARRPGGLSSAAYGARKDRNGSLETVTLTRYSNFLTYPKAEDARQWFGR